MEGQPMKSKTGGRSANPLTTAPGTVRQVTLAGNARSLSTLPRVDYEDAFLVEVGTAPDRTGEQWARAALEGAPTSVRGGLQKGWLALGLRLDRDQSGQSVLGWELRHSDAEFALLGARSRFGMPAELLFKPQQETLLFATFVQQQNPIARALWAAVAPRHRRVVPHLLGRAARAQEHQP
jgi:hypothetical protein